MGVILLGIVIALAICIPMEAATKAIHDGNKDDTLRDCESKKRM